MSRRPTEALIASAAAQRREADLAQRALDASAGMSHVQRRDYFAAQLRYCQAMMLETDKDCVGIVGPEDWKTYRDLLRYAEELIDAHPEPEPVPLLSAVDEVLADVRRMQAERLQVELVAKGCRFRRDDETLWVGPERLLDDDTQHAIRAVRDELLQMV